ncbi:hypothetical protein VFPFJ_09896 [Purpureocillium lilacinum]|uniref:Uncharacterized protein n=1 Tax=Purpureocillium lilacinum TaxID=33203 RepID=A0A179GEQ3_PURLI|nr:hypothetical protein VFPFJ_09896 [Purpureocillium lilacinum]OAQ76324.1 hypothetical protein VFPBJ_08684 [Purpureocillium lilacinum]OAQ79410.1 hypothetical protein VFPFJ_09896 [Purpureocillium lilacinum]
MEHVAGHRQSVNVAYRLGWVLGPLGKRCAWRGPSQLPATSQGYVATRAVGWRGPALRSGPDPCRRPIQALETVPSVPPRLGTGTELPRGTTTTAFQRSASHRRKGHTASPGRTSSDGFQFIPARTIQSHSFRVPA